MLVIHLFHVEVLDIAVKCGVPPGDVGIVAFDNKRQAGRSDAGYMEVACLQIGLIPDIRQRVIQMHIVREQRLATGGVLACDGPFIRA